MAECSHSQNSSLSSLFSSKQTSSSIVSSSDVSKRLSRGSVLSSEARQSSLSSNDILKEQASYHGRLLSKNRKTNESSNTMGEGCIEVRKRKSDARTGETPKDKVKRRNQKEVPVSQHNSSNTDCSNDTYEDDYVLSSQPCRDFTKWKSHSYIKDVSVTPRSVTNKGKHDKEYLFEVKSKRKRLNHRDTQQSLKKNTLPITAEEVANTTSLKKEYSPQNRSAASATEANLRPTLTNNRTYHEVVFPSQLSETENSFVSNKGSTWVSNGNQSRSDVPYSKCNSSSCLTSVPHPDALKSSDGRSTDSSTDIVCGQTASEYITVSSNSSTETDCVSSKVNTVTSCFSGEKNATDSSEEGTNKLNISKLESVTRGDVSGVVEERDWSRDDSDVIPSSVPLKIDFVRRKIHSGTDDIARNKTQSDRFLNISSDEINREYDLSFCQTAADLFKEELQVNTSSSSGQEMAGSHDKSSEQSFKLHDDDDRSHDRLNIQSRKDYRNTPIVKSPVIERKRSKKRKSKSNLPSRASVTSKNKSNQQEKIENNSIDIPEKEDCTKDAVPSQNTKYGEPEYESSSKETSCQQIIIDKYVSHKNDSDGLFDLPSDNDVLFISEEARKNQSFGSSLKDSEVAVNLQDDEADETKKSNSAEEKSYGSLVQSTSSSPQYLTNVNLKKLLRNKNSKSDDNITIEFSPTDFTVGNKPRKPPLKVKKKLIFANENDVEQEKNEADISNRDMREEPATKAYVGGFLNWLSDMFPSRIPDNPTGQHLPCISRPSSNPRNVSADSKQDRFLHHLSQAISSYVSSNEKSLDELEKEHLNSTYQQIIMKCSNSQNDIQLEPDVNRQPNPRGQLISNKVSIDGASSCRNRQKSWADSVEESSSRSVERNLYQDRGPKISEDVIESSPSPPTPIKWAGPVKKPKREKPSATSSTKKKNYIEGGMASEMQRIVRRREFNRHVWELKKNKYDDVNSELLTVACVMEADSHIFVKSASALRYVVLPSISLDEFPIEEGTEVKLFDPRGDILPEFPDFC